MLRPLPPLIVAALLAAATLSGCGSSEDNPEAGTTPSGGSTLSTEVTGTASSPGAPSTPTSPTAVPVTAPGTRLKVGQKATLGWSPKQQVQGILDVTVTQLQSTTYQQSFEGWQLDAQTRTRAPYFVRATVTNAGTTPLGGYPVPLYALDGADDLVEASTFASSFAPCEPGTLPKRFPPGATAQVCLVYLVPHQGKLVGVSFRPTESFDPITWTGRPRPYTPAAAPKKHAAKHRGANG